MAKHVDIDKIEWYWNDIPVGKENAVSYAELTLKWGRNARDVRMILHDLSLHDNGDDYILIRSAKKGGGFYKTMNPDEISDYRKECLAKGKSNFAPLKKINRVLQNNVDQMNFTNNLRVMREVCGLKQTEVCDAMKRVDEHFDVPLLSKMENGVCIPTIIQCNALADLYGCSINALICYEMFME